MIRLSALVLTVFTGFTGLTYDVIWQKYLATLLGAHSEATAAVLGIFLGGLSFGYWVFGGITRRLDARGRASGSPPRLLVLYGAVEAGIGAWCLLFAWIFRGARVVSVALPGDGGGVSFALDIALTAALIGPAAVLMGATIPVLTQALSRGRFSQTPSVEPEAPARGLDRTAAPEDDS